MSFTQNGNFEAEVSIAALARVTKGKPTGNPQFTREEERVLAIYESWSAESLSIDTCEMLVLISLRRFFEDLFTRAIPDAHGAYA